MHGHIKMVRSKCQVSTSLVKPFFLGQMFWATAISINTATGIPRGMFLIPGIFGLQERTSYHRGFTRGLAIKFALFQNGCDPVFVAMCFPMLCETPTLNFGSRSQS